MVGNELLISGIGFKRAGWESSCGELAFAWRRACLVVKNGRPFIARSVAIHSPFTACFCFKRAPVVRIERGNFFLTPTVVQAANICRLGTFALVRVKIKETTDGFLCLASGYVYAPPWL